MFECPQSMDENLSAMSAPATHPDIETPHSSPPEEKLDIEHAFVEDDPRKWSSTRKTIILIAVSGAAVICGLGANLYNPAIAQIESDLHASSGDISWSISLYILLLGDVPLIWSAFSELYGRKKIYIVSFGLGLIGCIVLALAKTVGVLIGMRCVQAAGASAVFAIGAATLADIYDAEVRGSMMGIYYSAPLLGPALGPIIGGALTQAFSWRATFWFIVIFTGLCFVGFIFFKDTYRKERSLTYQTVLKQRLRERAAKKGNASGVSISSHETAVSAEAKMSEKEKSEASVPPTAGTSLVDLSAQDLEGKAAPSREAAVLAKEMSEIKLTFKDVSPVGPVIAVVSRPNNVLMLLTSALIFSSSYSVNYTCARTLSDKYGYNALKIGLVLLSVGLGSMFGSIIGGRWSDYVFVKLKAKNGGISHAEMRLESTFLAMVPLPLSIIAYGWLAEKQVHIAALCVVLFIFGFCSISIYSSTLAYIVDANMGRSAQAVATNSAFRGTLAFAAAEVAIPLQNAIGDGGLYTLWAGILILAELCTLLTWWKGKTWREHAEEKEAQRS
ncbi:hypothetical protein QCA50_006461 [Cerrena zonata]|uniref:Major facilitator superfamily (MFS) profile domain-containing protein n=1 Tax=Cerrena zonata TaxID=2478898 RepID=A0AAW0GE40_9APHY